MEISTKTESYHLPQEFWGALMLVRNHLLQDPSFSFSVCAPGNRDLPLAKAFWLVDAWMTVHLSKEHDRRSA
jgi:hypothetical protein